MILRRFMLLIPKQNQLPELKFWWGYLFVNISFKIAMTSLLMLLVNMECFLSKIRIYEIGILICNIHSEINYNNKFSC